MGDIFTHSYPDGGTSFDLSFRYINDVFYFNNPRFENFTSHLPIKNITDTNSASYIVPLIEIDGKNHMTELFDKHDDFAFRIVKFPFICGNWQHHFPPNGLIILQLIRNARTC